MAVAVVRADDGEVKLLDRATEEFCLFSFWSKKKRKNAYPAELILWSWEWFSQGEACLSDSCCVPLQFPEPGAGKQTQNNHKEGKRRTRDCRSGGGGGGGLN